MHMLRKLSKLDQDSMGVSFLSKLFSALYISDSEF